MQQRIRGSCEKLSPGFHNTVVTLTHPYPLVTFRQKPLSVCHSAGRCALGRERRFGGNMKKTGLLILLLAISAGAQSGGPSASAAAADQSAPAKTIPNSESFP